MNSTLRLPIGSTYCEVGVAPFSVPYFSFALDLADSLPHRQEWIAYFSSKEGPQEAKSDDGKDSSEKGLPVSQSTLERTAGKADVEITLDTLQSPKGERGLTVSDLTDNLSSGESKDKHAQGSGNAADSETDEKRKAEEKVGLDAHSDTDYINNPSSRFFLLVGLRMNCVGCC